MLWRESLKISPRYYIGQVLDSVNLTGVGVDDEAVDYFVLR
jgi:hypothetical protein